MRALLEILSPTLDKFSVGVEDRDRILASIMDKDPVLRIDCDAMRVTPAHAIWKCAPVRHEFIGMLAAPEDGGFFAKQQHWGGSNSRRALDKTVSGNVH